VRQAPDNDPATVAREYASEHRFLRRRLTTWARLHGPLVEDAIVDAVAEVAPAPVIDIGCGTGDFTERLERDVGTPVVALDLSDRMVELALARGLDAVQGDVQALPFADGIFDCALANRVLYHVPNLARGLGEVARVLRPGGRLVAATYSAAHLEELWEHVGESPLASMPFSAESGGEVLAEHFVSVECRDFAGIARFPSRDAIVGYLESYGEFADGDLGARLGDVSTPFEASYRHSIFVASDAPSS
jgi:SAM-dependent methyltransferase